MPWSKWDFGQRESSNFQKQIPGLRSQLTKPRHRDFAMSDFTAVSRRANSHPPKTEKSSVVVVSGHRKLLQHCEWPTPIKIGTATSRCVWIVCATRRFAIEPMWMRLIGVRVSRHDCHSGMHCCQIPAWVRRRPLHVIIRK
jgi:hypothetical protein